MCKAMLVPFLTRKLVIIKDECAVTGCARILQTMHTHGFLKIAAGERMR